MKNNNIKDYVMYIILIFIIGVLFKLDNKIQINDLKLRKKTIIDTIFVVDTANYDSMNYIDY